MAMPVSPEENYQAISRANQRSEPWKKYFVRLAGKTDGAHRDFTPMLKGINQKEVSSPEESDYILVFCPVTSRLGTDINEALEDVTVDKPIILVVMHHTLNPDLPIAETRRLVMNPNVYLTVDFMFNNGKLLKCNRNKFAWLQLLAFIAQSFQDSSRKRVIVVAIVVFVVIMVVVVAIVISLLA